MATPNARDWSVILGYGVGVGIAFVGALGVWLQYSQAWLDALGAGALSFGVGAVLGGLWAYMRRVGLD